MIGLFILAGVLSSTTACGPTKVLIDGREMSPEDAAAYLLAEGRKAQEAGDLANAKSDYKEVYERFPESARAADALAELGAIYLDESGCKGALYYYERLARDYATSPRAGSAKEVMGRCQAEGDGKSGALVKLENQYLQSGNDAEKKEVASKAADAAMEAGEFGQAADWLLKVRSLERDDASKRAVEAEILELIDAKVTFQDVRSLLETAKSDFPAEALTYKLGRIQYHIRDLANAKSTLESLLSTWPSSSYLAGAKSMLELIEARSKVVPGKIGVLVPISGKLKAYGENALQAVKLASGQMNAAKPDTRFEFVVRDSKGDPAAAAQAVQDFVTVDGVVAVFGALFRVEAESAATKAQELGVPLLSLTAAEDITETGPFVFRNGLTSSAQMDALVEYAMDVLGMKRFSILYPKHPYGEAMLHLFWDRVEARRGEVSGVESYGANDTTFTGPVKRLVGRSRLDLRSDYRLAKRECEKQPDSYRKARCVRELDASIKPIVDFDGLFIPDYPRSLALITPALAAEDIVVERDERYIRRIERTLGRTVKPVTLLGASGWNSNELPEKAGRYVENAIFIDGFFADSESKEVRSFVDAFRREFKRTPGLPEAQFYDAARLMKEVVLKEMPTTREAMRQALRKVHDFPGVTGKTSLVESNEAKRKVSVLTIKEGRIIEAPPPSEQAPSVPATPAGAPPAG